MKRIFAFSCILAGLFAIARAQNLVPNPGFEDMRRCPRGLGQLDRTARWSSPNGGSPDYFHRCYDRDHETAGVPNNYFGTRASYEGDAYAGILHGQQEQEYLQVTLADTLVRGRSYCLRLRASAPSAQSDARASLRCYVASAPVAQKDWGPLRWAPEHVLAGTWSAIGQDPNWELFAASFVARGGETQLVVGYDSAAAPRTYTFIDLVEVFENPEGPCGLVEPALAAADSSNLLPNPGFERKFGCPTKREDLSLAAGWHVAANSPDFYHVCGTGTAAVPANELGVQSPHGGNGYGGIWAMLQERGDYREFVQTRLKSPLVAGKAYCLSIWVSLAEDSDHALDQLQLLVTQPDDRRTGQVGVDSAELVTLRNGRLLDDQRGWTFLHGTFTAQGGEQLVMIGNFRPNDDPHMHRISDVPPKGLAYANCAYYYIDDLGLHAVGDPACACPGAGGEPLPDTVPLQPAPAFEVGDTLVLRNLKFESDSHALLPASFPQLDSLADYLRTHAGLRVHITGHTDSDGEEAYNLALSAQRAGAVQAYLQGAGIAPDRLSSVGRGESMPCAPNASETGKALNRRVEVEFL